MKMKLPSSNSSLLGELNHKEANSSLLGELNHAEDNSSLLDQLNHEEAKQYIGGVVFVSLLMVIGIIGNIHVLLVFTFRFKPSNHRVFILVLGAFDLTMCCVGMPFVIVDLRNPLKFTWSSSCKLLRFITYFICLSSALTLLVMAVDRYRKVCAPLRRQLSHHRALACCCLVIFIAALLSWPSLVLFGASTIPTSYPDVNGVRCYTEDRFKDTKYILYFNAVLILVVLNVGIVLAVIYLRIGRRICRHKHFRHSAQQKPSVSKRKHMNSASETSETKETSVSVSGSSGEMKTPENETSTSTLNGVITLNDDITTLKKPRKITQDPEVEGKAIACESVRRTTFIFFVLTTVFVTSYLPHFALEIVTFTKADFVPNLPFYGKVMYNLFPWSFFINNMANIIIYGYCDHRFRQEVRKAYSQMFNALLCRR